MMQASYLGSLAVAIRVAREQLPQLDLEPGLLAQLSQDRVLERLARLAEPAGEVPAALERLDAAAPQQHAISRVAHDRRGRRARVEIGRLAAREAVEANALRLAQRPPAAGAEARDPSAQSAPPAAAGAVVSTPSGASSRAR